MGYYGENDSPERLEKFLREKLTSRGVNVDGLVFWPTLTKKRKVKVEVYRGKNLIASANVGSDGSIRYSMPKTDPKQGW